MNGEAADLTGPPPDGTSRTVSGAVESFTTIATWLVASPAARDEPDLAVEELGDELLNSVDAEVVTNMNRSEGDDFEVDRGAYRVLGFAGPEERPNQVMVEVIAPLTMAGNTRWGIVGGVVQWSDGKWNLVSIAPRELADVEPEAQESRTVPTPSDSPETLEGLGWRTFAGAEGE